MENKIIGDEIIQNQEEQKEAEKESTTLETEMDKTQKSLLQLAHYV